jgi:hypothetical protein
MALLPAAEVATLRAIASADVHNPVFQRDYRSIRAILSGRTEVETEDDRRCQEVREFRVARTG